MSKHETTEGKMDCLVSRPDMKPINVKFFRGANDVITPAEFTRELHAASQRKLHKEIEASASAPQCTGAPIDVRKFVADM